MLPGILMKIVFNLAASLHAPGGGMFVVKYDASGNVIWGRTDAGNTSADALALLPIQAEMYMLPEPFMVHQSNLATLH
jgi:hypothetical protein